MGYRVHTFSPDRDSPTGQIADVEIDAPYEDLDRVREFASAVDVVTFEFENVPAATAEAAAECALVRPAGEVLHITQHRLREKTFLRDARISGDALRADPQRRPTCAALCPDLARRFSRPPDSATTARASIA